MGALAGMTEVFCQQPTVAWKNAMQEGRPIPFAPRVMYRGVLVNAFSIAPCNATQFAVNSAASSLFRRLRGDPKAELSMAERLAGAVTVRLRTASGDPVYVAHASGAVFTTPAGAMCSFDDGDAFRLLQEGDAAGGCRFSLAAGPSGNAVEVAPPGGGDLSRGFLVAYRRLGTGGPAAFSLERLADDRWALVTPDRERVVAGRKLDDGSRNIRIGARGARGDFVVAVPDQ